MKFALSVLLIIATPLFATYTLKEGKLINAEEVATKSVQEHYSAALEAYQKQQWQEVIHQATIVMRNFPETPFYQEALFYLGAAYYHLGEFETANNQLSSYLKKQAALQHFRDAIELKFQIAEHFQGGAKKHMLGWQALPKWIPAYEEAMQIYDEVISALPNDDLAAKALFGKAALQLSDDEFTASIESYQTLIRRFPKHSLAPEAYVQIAKVYLKECQEKYPDTDYLDLAEINLKKFRYDFPSDERVATVEQVLADMQEIYAQSFYEIGQFFERTKKPHASVIYYTKIIKTFPNTKSAEMSKKRMKALRLPVESRQTASEATTQSELTVPAAEQTEPNPQHTLSDPGS